MIVYFLAMNSKTCKYLVHLAKLILENNYFKFDGCVYRQKLGMAIGTKFASGFANTFMADLEAFLQTCLYKPRI